jgi:hypothetical protein
MHNLTIPAHSLLFNYTENRRTRGKRVVGNKSVIESLLQLPLDTFFAPTNIYWAATYAPNEPRNCPVLLTKSEKPVQKQSTYFHIFD